MLKHRIFIFLIASFIPQYPILAAIAIPQFNQYKIRGYDAHSKQALKDMHLLCNAYWLDTDSTQGCDLPKIKDPTYGFNQNADVVATLPSSPLDNFCASAKHNSSPNTYSIDSAALISTGSGCSEAGGASPGDESVTEETEEDEKEQPFQESCTFSIEEKRDTCQLDIGYCDCTAIGEPDPSLYPFNCQRKANGQMQTRADGNCDLGTHRKSYGSRTQCKNINQEAQKKKRQDACFATGE
jgi:type IV pilus assembly protein PilA